MMWRRIENEKEMEKLELYIQNDKPDFIFPEFKQYPFLFVWTWDNYFVLEYIIYYL